MKVLQNSVITSLFVEIRRQVSKPRNLYLVLFLVLIPRYAMNCQKLAT